MVKREFKNQPATTIFRNHISTTTHIQRCAYWLRKETPGLESHEPNRTTMNHHESRAKKKHNRRRKWSHVEAMLALPKVTFQHSITGKHTEKFTKTPAECHHMASRGNSVLWSFEIRDISRWYKSQYVTMYKSLKSLNVHHFFKWFKCLWRNNPHALEVLRCLFL